MTGLTVAMAPAVEPSSASFQRSSSTPDLMSLPSFEFEQPTHHRRSKSGKELSTQPAFDVPSFNTEFALDTSVFAVSRPSSPVRPATSAVEPVHEKPPRLSIARARTSSIIDRPRSWFPGSKQAKRAVEEQPQRPITSVGEGISGDRTSKLPDLRPAERSSLAVSDSFANFAKRSWMSSSKSRSPSPKGRAKSPPSQKNGGEDGENQASPKKSKASKHMAIAAAEAEQSRSDSLKPTPKAFTRASSYLAKMKQKQPMSFAKFNSSPDSDNSCASSAASLGPPSNSNDTHTSKPTSIDSNTNTDDSSGEMGTQARDALWSSFKTLETELKGFLSKQTGQRIAQLQTTILPFLRGTTNHASVKRLRPEDVDRRATILNQWWVVILEMLEGQPQQQPVAGVDRPVLLEAATIIMVRSEWRQTTSYFQPLADRSSLDCVQAKRSWTTSSASSVASTQDEFLSESAEHNVRTMFVSNLLKQMGLVVDKMSLRHAPLSLVNFAGKTCAYAFFFAPGVADILVRLWALNPELLRRASDELGLSRRRKQGSDNFAASFPPNLSGFAWTSPKGMWETLKQTHQMPMPVARIPWTGPWVMRWKGRDTDLFFIFCKYFYILFDQFVQPELPLKEKAQAPGFILVQAQLLGLLDTTIHRQAAPMNGYGQPPLLDSMHGSDASALAIQFPPTNLAKGMSENRLVILLKDFLPDESIGFAGARHTFAEAFASVMKAATRKTSQFNSTACFTLCDFMEEVLPVYSDNEMPAVYFDWAFWIDVWKKILGSLNTMSEIRVLAFVYAAWDVLAKDPDRKEMLCLNWLLREDVFDTFFNHWCPMVRAYYQRLLCWRICRDGGSANELDARIFLVAATRLKTIWSHYLYLKVTAEDEGRFPPSTAPMLPTPGKKFMIIRQEVNTPQPGLFMGFDSFSRTPGADPLTTDALADASTLSKTDPKKRWSLLGKVLSLTGASSAPMTPMNGHGRGSSWDELQNARRETAEARSRSGAPPPPPKITAPYDRADARSGSSSPVFDEPKHVFRFFLGWQQSTMPPRERILIRPRLPAPAQSRVSLRVRSGAPPPAPGLPSPARMVSGSPKIGLIQGAKNASSPIDTPVPESAARPFVSFSQLNDEVIQIPTPSDDDATPTQISAGMEPSTMTEEPQERIVEPLTQAVKPTRLYTKNAVYSGRALAEWGQIVFECNAFIDRRRDEGILGLSEVEVPLLGVEGFRKLGG